MLARQGRTVRVCTKDLIPFDRVRREAAGDDSGEESDWLDCTCHPKGHIKSLGKKAANRTLLNNGLKDDLPAAYASDESKRTELQKQSFEKQKPSYTGSSSIKEALVVRENQKLISNVD